MSDKLKLKLKVEGSAVKKALNKFHISAKGIKDKDKKIKVDSGKDKPEAS